MGWEPYNDHMDTPRLIHVVFKTHLDIGYTGQAADVISQYMTSFIPAALERAEQMRKLGDDRFIWTTGSYLIDEYLATASPGQHLMMDKAIRRGDIAWHALPFTTATEMCDGELFRSALQIAADLDQKYGRKTVAAKMTDVPGHTRSIIPFMAEAGVMFLHIGVNGASSVPKVPPVFRWKHPEGAELLVMYHHGYGDLMLVPGLDEGLYIAHTNDNLGPQSVESIQEIFANLRRRFPLAEVRASTLDAFALALDTVRDSLPVVTEEIGDTWIHGQATDPLKTAWLRELMRLRSEWLAGGAVRRESATYKRFSRQLLLTCEHTCGLDVKTFFGYNDAFTREKFQQLRSKGLAKDIEASWAEQRGYLQTAWLDLEDEALSGQVRERMALLRPVRPNPGDPAEGWTRTDPYLPFGEGDFLFGFNGEGGLGWLEDRESGKMWASPYRTIGALVYQTFNAADYERFYRQYIIDKKHTEGWARPDFTMPGLENTPAISRIWVPKLERLYQRMDGDAQQFLLYLLFPSQAVDEYGAPAVAWLEWNIPLRGRQLDLTVSWFDKAANRMPEAAWLRVNPALRGGRWEMDKMGSWVDPLDVVANGSRHLHAVGEGIRWTGNKGRFVAQSLDAALVAPGKESLLNFTNRQPQMGKGMQFLLHDNLWGTNFPLWFEDDMQFRFRFEFLDPEQEGGER